MNASKKRLADRRSLLVGGSKLFGVAALTSAARLFAAEPHKKQEEEEEVTPAEDLMREHGALNRILLIYDEAIVRIESKKEFPPEVLASAARIIRRFIEEYHEKLEEDYLFPRFEKAGVLVDLVQVLRQQHAAGRTLTRQIEKGGTLASLRSAAERDKTRRALRLFTRMYR